MQPTQEHLKIQTNDGGSTKSSSNNQINNIKIIGEQSIGNIKDKIMTSDGQVYYPCRFCNKVFSIRKARTNHTANCPSKSYILSVNDSGIEHKQQEEELDNNIHEIADDGNNIKENISNESLSQKLINEKLQSLPEINVTIINKQSNLPARKPSPSKKSSPTKKQSPTKKPSPTTNMQELVTCQLCNSLFNSSMDLLRHQRIRHRFPKIILSLDEIKQYYNIKERSKCPICYKELKLTSRSVLIKHLHTHTNLMNYTCDVCKKKFRRLDHMKTHAKRHIITV